MIKPLALTAGLALLAACSEPGHQQLSRQLDTLDSRPSGRIEALPEAKEPEPIRYNAGHLRSPFQLHRQQTETRAHPATQWAQPDLKRDKSPLEQIPLENLTLVGTLKYNGAKHFTALVDDGQGEVHTLQPGDYLGQDFGQVADITEDTLFIEETVQDELGGWMKRSRQLTLAVETDD